MVALKKKDIQHPNTRAMPVDCYHCRPTLVFDNNTFKVRYSLFFWGMFWAAFLMPTLQPFGQMRIRNVLKSEEELE
jgi:hypothetical protein